MHEQFLLAALEQARFGQGQCAPNPSVGAVAVQNGKIIARAWHHGAGTPHAESLLLAQITPKTPEVSLYITLEPCNHWGKTPPCVQAIINHGIQHVIFASLDPNPVVAKNNSTAQLEQQGIKVSHIPVEAITEFYESYNHWTKTNTPRLTAKMAQTFDGKIGRTQGERVILSNALCSEFTHQIRAASDVILTTAQTIRADNPKMTARLHDKEQAKPVAIIDRNLSLRGDEQIFSTASHCHIYHQQDIHTVYPNSTFHRMPVKNEFLDLDAIVSHLGATGYHDVLVEAGGALFSALHKEGLVHRTYLYLVPTLLGQNAVSAYQADDILNRKFSISWQAMGNNMLACLDWLEDSCLPD